LTKSPSRCDLSLVFDGGSLGNPGKGYGSFHLADRHGFEILERLTYGDNVTNNQAEYRTLIAGVEASIERCRAAGYDPKALAICIKTDSKLVVEQVNGRWKVRHPELQPLCREGQRLLSRFGLVELSWQPRAETVRRLGH
jgi:probable phosphoglycerate mutase